MVLGGTGGVWQVRTDEGQTVDAALRGRLKKSNSGKRADGSLRRDTVLAAAETLKLAVGDDVVLERVRNYWELPKWLQEQNLSAQVTIYIDRKGQMTRYVFTKPSGNESFDGEVKRTLQSAVPFPEPPIAIIPDVSQQGIVLGFPI